MVLDFTVASFFGLVLINGVAIVIFVWAVVKAPWSLIFEVSLRQNLLLGSIFGLTIFWLMDFALTPLVIIHPIMITSVVLMVGLRFCLLVGAIASAVYCAFSVIDMLNVAGHFLLNVACPATFIWGSNRWLRSKNPSNLFFYTLGLGFIGSALTIPLVGTIGTGLSYCLDIALVSEGTSLQFEWILLAMFPEAFINGVIVSSITVFYPEWMKTFDEEYFLSK
ncbi:MAG: hypothetical protein HWE27_15160 [Gammaproteobacteria bacterium]|nr:hypothetical protein [Gammaproteobacteria bacterium]